MYTFSTLYYLFFVAQRLSFWISSMYVSPFTDLYILDTLNIEAVNLYSMLIVIFLYEYGLLQRQHFIVHKVLRSGHFLSGELRVQRAPSLNVDVNPSLFFSSSLPLYSVWSTPYLFIQSSLPMPECLDGRSGLPFRCATSERNVISARLLAGFLCLRSRGSLFGAPIASRHSTLCLLCPMNSSPNMIKGEGKLGFSYF